MFRAPIEDVARLGNIFTKELRRSDLPGRYSDTHLVVLMPEYTASDARTAVTELLGEITPPIDRVSIGVAECKAAGGTFEDLLEKADMSLAKDRVARNGDASGQTTILLAEDDPDVMHIVDARLRAEDYRTVLALDGQQTLDGIERESPAVVILDLMMPKLTGFEVLGRLRDLPGAKRPKTIVVSARGRDEDVARAFELSADDDLTKPFNPDELVARIARLIR